MNFPRLRCLLLVLCVPWLAHGQTVNSGSDGSDGAFNPIQQVGGQMTYVTIDMADHPDGIYHYTSVNIPTGVTVLFKPNARNTPVVWLVQGSCEVNGTVNVSGQWGERTVTTIGGSGGPGGYAGGNGSTVASPGQGPGGGLAGNSGGSSGGHASFGTVGAGAAAGIGIYGNQYLVPLIGGSGGGGYANAPYFAGGGGGGGAILVAASQPIKLNGAIYARGSEGASISGFLYPEGGSGSGGSVRLVTPRLAGSGTIDATGGTGIRAGTGGLGRVRLDVFENVFGGTIGGQLSQGFQSLILPAAGQGIRLSIASVAGGSVPANPSSSLANPAVIVPAQQASSVPVVVQCFNVPLNTPITVTAKPANGAVVSASGFNSSGTTAASTATIHLNLPRGSGILVAKATVAVAPGGAGGQESPPSRNGGLENPRSQPTGDEAADSKVRAPGGADFPVRSNAKLADLPYSISGLTTDGERIAVVEVEATLGGGSRTVYVTESGKRLPAPSGK